MRSYWLKIIVGACAVFLVGFAGVTVIRKSKDKIRSIAESSDPVSLPLAFLPFTLDGVKAGTFKGIRLDRDAPKSLNGITLRISLADSADAARRREWTPSSGTPLLPSLPGSPQPEILDEVRLSKSFR